MITQILTIAGLISKLKIKFKGCPKVSVEFINKFTMCFYNMPAINALYTDQ